MVTAKLLLVASASLGAAHVIELSGDSTSTYISGGDASIDFAFGSEEAVKATVTSEGKVGIGTKTPTQHLSVMGATASLSVTSGGKGGANYILMGNQDSSGEDNPTVLRAWNGILQIGSGDSWTSATGGTFTNSIHFANNGKVGIGTDNPTRTLHISDANGANLQIDRPGWAGKLYFEADGTDGIVRAHGGSAGLRFQTGSEDTRLHITNGGEVVIPAGGSLKWSSLPRGEGEILGHNLIVNGGAETGDTTGWTHSQYYGAQDACGAGQGTSGSSGWGAPYEGNTMFYLSNCGSIYQTLKLHTGTKYTFSAWNKVHLSGSAGDGSAGRLRVVFKGHGYDENANVLSIGCNPNNYDVSPHLKKWVQCFIQFTVPDIADVDLLDTEIWIESWGRTHSVNFDNVMVNRGHVVSAYSEKYDPGTARRSLREADTEKIDALEKTVHDLQARSDALLQRLESLEKGAKL